MGSRVLKNGVMWALAAASFVAIFALQLPFPAIVLVAGLLGYAGARVAPQFFSAAPAHKSAARHYGAALIDDDTAPPAHARFSRGRLAAVLAVGAALWLAPMAVLLVTQGVAGTYTQMAWFFTKAALLTFGGAYAVLPYVYQGAVVHFGWLTPTQMIDGLALGETTPGPLIMVVAFVAFVGAWQSAELVALFGPDRLFLAAALAATLVTWFTFLPSFVFILAGGPLVEATHDRLAFTGPLTAITAAVVGVVLNLALFFAWHVLWPQGWQGGFDTAAGAITVAAVLALLRYKRGVIEVIAACAVAGLAWQLLR
jgi:chromate transporter